MRQDAGKRGNAKAGRLKTRGMGGLPMSFRDRSSWHPRALFAGRARGFAQQRFSRHQKPVSLAHEFRVSRNPPGVEGLDQRP